MKTSGKVRVLEVGGGKAAKPKGALKAPRGGANVKSVHVPPSPGNTKAGSMIKGRTRVKPGRSPIY